MSVGPTTLRLVAIPFTALLQGSRVHTDLPKSGSQTRGKAPQHPKPGRGGHQDLQGAPSYSPSWGLLLVLDNTPEIFNLRLRTSTIDEDCGGGNG